MGTIAGIGFAVSILIATLAFTGTQLQEAKLGVLTTVLAAPALTWLVFRGPARALVTIVEYGDFECPYCGRAEPVLRELLAGHGDVRYVWRHLPLNDVHPHAHSPPHPPMPPGEPYERSSSKRLVLPEVQARKLLTMPYWNLGWRIRARLSCLCTRSSWPICRNRSASESKRP